MTKKHNIKISSEFNNRVTTNIFVIRYVRDFMSWLAGQGHEVSYAEDVHTTVDGKDISKDEVAREIYTKLSDEFEDYRH